MSRKKTTFILFFMMIIVIVVGWKTLTARNPVPSVDHTHLHAAFQVYVDGQLQDFSSFRYMSLVPCGDHGKKLTPEEEQHEKAHLHESIGDVVHVHRAGATWGDLFLNLAYQFDDNKELVAYVNGEIVDDIFTYPIENYDTVIIVSGDQSQADQFVSQADFASKIAEVEQQSELCGSN